MEEADGLAPAAPGRLREAQVSGEGFEGFPGGLTPRIRAWCWLTCFIEIAFNHAGAASWRALIEQLALV